MQDVTTDKISRPFEQEAVEVLARLRGSLLVLVRTLCDEPGKASELRDRLGLDYKLCWNISRLLTSPNLLAAGLHVPTPAGMRLFLDAAGPLADDVQIEAVVDSASEFEQLVRAHSGDRGSFNAMIGAFAGHLDVITLAHRRSAYRANRQLWGLQAQAQLKCALLAPSDDPTFLDVAQVDGFVKLGLLRADARAVVAHARVTDDKGDVLPELLREPIDPRGAGEHGMGLLADFCSKPLPSIEWIRTHHSFVHGELKHPAIGNLGAATVMIGTVSRKVAKRYRAEHNAYGSLNARVYLPCETLLVDLAIRKDTYAGGVNPRAMVIGEVVPGPPTPAPSRERDMLPVGVSAKYLGRGSGVMHTEEVPDYVSMVQSVFDRLGWQAEEFDVFRCRLEYPIMPATVVLKFNLPEDPG